MALRRRAASDPQAGRAAAIDLRRFSRRQLERMAGAGREVAECESVLAKTGDTVVGELLRHQPFFEWDHYPAGEVFDPETQALYYYHAHPSEQRDAEEHGHFHTFIRAIDLPQEIRPLPLPTCDAEGEVSGLAHLVAIAVDAEGTAYRLFTTNRWVTGESWYRAQDLIRLLELFHVGHARPSWPANRWITAMLTLFRPQVIMLLEERDRTVAAWAKSHPESPVTEDRRLEIVTSLRISLIEQRRAVDAALAERAHSP
jgi:hypothetical protein